MGREISSLAVTVPSDRHFNRNEHRALGEGAFKSDLEVRKAFWQAKDKKGHRKSKGQWQWQVGSKDSLSGQGDPHSRLQKTAIKGYIL